METSVGSICLLVSTFMFCALHQFEILESKRECQMMKHAHPRRAFAEATTLRRLGLGVAHERDLSY